MIHATFRMAPAAWAALALTAGHAAAQTLPDVPHTNLYGVTGVLDTPTALNQPDAELTFNVSNFAGINRNTLSFQVLPRVQASFRYSGFQNLNLGGFEDYYDRSFDLSIQVLKERQYIPAVKIGFQDFIGTGLLSGEYIVATKTFWQNRVQVSGGIGWGRLGSEDSFGSPFGERPDRDFGLGGDLEVDQFFRGPAAGFGSVSVEATERLTLLAEYSSDAYRIETRPRSDLFDRESSFNFGAAYRISDNVTLGASYLYGSEFGLNLTFVANPNRPRAEGGTGPAPLPVLARPARSTDPGAYTDRWLYVKDMQETFLGILNDELDGQGIEIVSLNVISADLVEVHFRNIDYIIEAQAVGRVARTLARNMPASVSTFRLVPVVNTVPTATVLVDRATMERTVNAPGGSRAFADSLRFEEPVPIDPTSAVDPDYVPRFSWSVGPFTRRLLFNPNDPLQFSVGVRARATYTPTPGLIFSGAVSKDLLGDFDTLDDEDVGSGDLPQVRTDFNEFNEQTDVGLERLTGAYYFRPADNFYGRVTAGYLERAYGGLSTEVLYKPVNSVFGVGAELNYARKRDYDGGFGFQEFDAVTGFVSGYAELPEGFDAQLDVGRYLAGDLGATLTVSREFANGWRIGAFATRTDVSAEDFGEGSFDKGINISVPLSWFLGTPTRQRVGTSISPVTRDGGQRLNVSGRLYELVDDYHRGSIDAGYGAIWR